MIDEITTEGNSPTILTGTTGGIVMQLILGWNSKTTVIFYKGKKTVKYNNNMKYTPLGLSKHSGLIVVNSALQNSFHFQLNSLYISNIKYRRMNIQSNSVKM
jgi:hypothetical protein